MNRGAKLLPETYFKNSQNNNKQAHMQGIITWACSPTLESVRQENCVFNTCIQLKDSLAGRSLANTEVLPSPLRSPLLMH